MNPKNKQKKVTKAEMKRLKNIKKAHVKIGVLTLPLKKSNSLKFAKKMLRNDQFFKYNTKLWKNPKSVGKDDHKKFAFQVLRNFSKYSFFPTGYVKQYIGSNIFDTFPEIEVTILFGSTY